MKEALLFRIVDAPKPWRAYRSDDGGFLGRYERQGDAMRTLQAEGFTTVIYHGHCRPAEVAAEISEIRHEVERERIEAAKAGVPIGRPAFVFNVDTKHDGCESQCQCEHAAHFEGRAHKYAESFPTDLVTEVQTILGRFTVCVACANTHLKGFIK